MTFDASASADLLSAAQALDEHTVELRREIHRDPELGLQLPNTQKRILDSLTGLGLDITMGTSTTSVVADLDTGRPGPTVLLRGDMDALPMTEDYETDFQSQHEDRMHSCGHDAHVAMLASTARLLSENADQLTGRVRFMFQPGEEGFHGAKHMIDEGVLDGVDRAFAIHVMSNAPDGLIATKGGPLMASADEFQITMAGRGGHASMPHFSLDPIPPAAATVGALANLVSREVDASKSGVVTVAHIEAGTTNNVIPASAFLEGTIRALDEQTRTTLRDGVERVAHGIAAAHGCDCTCEVTPGYPVTVNDPEQAELVGEIAVGLFGQSNYITMPNAVMGAEDWSYVLQQVPGAMAFMGVCPADVPLAEAAPNHSNLMRISEEKLFHGVGLYAAMAMAG
ncbi:MAG: amidohydrolase [Acidimicrobiales bacterium]|nr:amidohydrolase [Acidimicrobiales bacterium]